MGKKRPNVSMKKKQLLKSFDSIGTINYSCLNCGIKEKISKDVIQFFDAGDNPENVP